MYLVSQSLPNVSRWIILPHGQSYLWKLFLDDFASNALSPSFVAGCGSPLTFLAPCRLQDKGYEAPCWAQLVVATAGIPHFLELTWQGAIPGLCPFPSLYLSRIIFWQASDAENNLLLSNCCVPWPQLECGACRSVSFLLSLHSPSPWPKFPL